VFSGVLNGMHRFDLITAVAIMQSVLSAAGLFVLIRSGHSIVAIALLQLTMTVLGSLSLLLLALRTYPQLRVSFDLPDKHIVRELWSYSLLLFMIAISGRIIYYTDNLVIAAFLPVSAVTFYAIGGNLVEYLREILSSLAVTFMPAASNLEALEQRPQLHRLLVQGTRAVLLVALPIEAALYFRGSTFIRLWMGPEYGAPSGRVLQVLLLAWFFIAGNFCSGNIIFGLAKHRPVAVWTAMEAVANLSLSIFLVRRIGSIGVAWGTVIPSLIINALLWPRYITKIVGMSLRTYVGQAWLKPAVAVLPFAAACYLSDRFWPAKHLIVFFLQIGASLPLVLLGVIISFGDEAIVQLRRGTTWLAANVRA
jgi:O-antigen/teichoic acid export membrane protein